MAETIVDRIFAQLDSPLIGSVRLDAILEDIEIKESVDLKTRKTMNKVRRARGFTEGTPEISVDLTVLMVVPPPVDWFKLRRARDTFRITYDDGEAGQRFQIRDCRIADISKSANADGDTTLKVSLMALDHVADS